MRTISEEQFKKQFGKDTYNQFGQPQQKPSLGKQVGNFAGGLAKDIASPFARVGVSGYNALVGEEGQERNVPFVGETKPIASPVKEGGIFTPPGQKFGLQQPIDFKALGDVAKTGLEIGTTISAPGATKVAAKGVINLTTKATEAGVQTGKQLVSQGKTALAAKLPTPVEAVKQVIQGKTKDVVSGVKGLKEVSTEGVKKYSQLATKVDDAIKNLSKKVDDALDNKVPVQLKKLSLSGTTTAGKKVVVDYVSRGLGHLKEVYKAIGDDIASKNIDELVKKARNVGLTRKEVNDLARTYGMEFGEKAFGKTGEALTSVNAKMFENTRKALKIVARQGMKGGKAEVIDKSISALFRVKKLVANNAEAVNKLAQKIQERGLLEKIGYQVTKAADVLTGGTLRGVMGGLLPRGVGYKVMNALDLEKVLERNLKIITKALEAGDEELIKLLK